MRDDASEACGSSQVNIFPDPLHRSAGLDRIQSLIVRWNYFNVIWFEAEDRGRLEMDLISIAVFVMLSICTPLQFS